MVKFDWQLVITIANSSEQFAHQHCPHSIAMLQYCHRIGKAIFKRGNGESGNRGTGNIGEYRGIFKRGNIGESLKGGI